MTTAEQSAQVRDYVLSLEECGFCHRISPCMRYLINFTVVANGWGCVRCIREMRLAACCEIDGRWVTMTV